MKIIDQDWQGLRLRHELFPADGEAACPTVILFPTVMGVTALERGFAGRLVAKGHTAVVADLYGERYTPERRDEAVAAMNRLRGDRAALRDLLLAVLGEVQAQNEVDDEKIAAIGFCFGGQCALDLARSGTQVAGVASFHGLFDVPGLEPRPIRAKVIAYHGWDDPMVKPDAVVALGRELTEAGCDWQIHAFGHVAHGFTNPQATGAIAGVQFDETAARRSWAHFDLFLDEIFE